MITTGHRRRVTAITARHRRDMPITGRRRTAIGTTIATTMSTRGIGMMTGTGTTATDPSAV
ncbi:hypothetical protein [Novosphingobium sp. PhB165]|uniref:hypothetical protein n=1 Tax=Novosphingobium sp. PhB165 TaxID=2485105 RepID=UPI00140553E8|nr:hypothetical protein [Novosphingobium sp. PhB165]